MSNAKDLEAPTICTQILRPYGPQNDKYVILNEVKDLKTDNKKENK